MTDQQEEPEPMESTVTALAPRLSEAQTITFTPVDPMVAMIEAVITRPDADLGKLEKLLELRERIEDDKRRRAFDQAIAAAKGEIGPIAKNRVVDFENQDKSRTTYRHEDFAEIARSVDPILARHGLSYRFRSEQDLSQGGGGRLKVTCILAHREGHAEETVLSASPDDSGKKNNFQRIGSAATYLQRYTLKLALGLAASNDDDAKTAGAQEDAAPKVLNVIGDAQLEELRDLMGKAGADEDQFLGFFRIEWLAELPAAKFDQAKSMLNQKIRAKGSR